MPEILFSIKAVTSGLSWVEVPRTPRAIEGGSVDLWLCPFITDKSIKSIRGRGPGLLVTRIECLSSFIWFEIYQWHGQYLKKLVRTLNPAKAFWVLYYRAWRNIEMFWARQESENDKLQTIIQQCCAWTLLKRKKPTMKNPRPCSTVQVCKLMVRKCAAQPSLWQSRIVLVSNASAPIKERSTEGKVESVVVH